MSIGSMVQKFRQKYQHGLATAYWRDIARPKILRTRPIDQTTDDRCELHVLTSNQDWLNLVWSLKSFYLYSRRRYRLCIHEDGSVPPEGIEQLQKHFPAGRLIRRADADARVLGELSAYPRCLQFRKTNLLSPKVFDFISYLQGERILLFDSDLLFFAEPVELLERIENPRYILNCFNGDDDSSYAVTSEDVRRCLGMELPQRVNSGLGLAHRASIRLDWIEEFLGLPRILSGHFWRIEQTLFALCGMRFGVELLPEAYTVHLGKGIRGPVRHYVGAVRHLMYVEGMKTLVGKGFLDM
jgi:hypothetical protein